MRSEIFSSKNFLIVSINLFVSPDISLTFINVSNRFMIRHVLKTNSFCAFSFRIFDNLKISLTLFQTFAYIAVVFN